MLNEPTIPVPKQAIDDLYSTYDGYPTGGASASGGTGTQSQVPFVKRCIAFKHGDCAMGDSWGFQHFTAAHITAKKKERMAAAKKNASNNATASGDNKAKPKGNANGQGTSTGKSAAPCVLIRPEWAVSGTTDDSNGKYD